MAAQQIGKIETIRVHSVIAGFRTEYEKGRFLRSEIYFKERVLRLYDAEGSKTHEVMLDPGIERLDIYHTQYGIAVSEAHDCFFLTSWLKGIYCCDLKTGQIRWNYRLKHATKIFLYEDDLLCAFQEIGLRKLSYEGEELDKYPMGGWRTYFCMEEPYLFMGPSRNAYNVIDTRSMSVVKKVKEAYLAEALGIDYPYLSISIVCGSGSLDSIHVEGFVSVEGTTETNWFEQEIKI